MVIVCIGLVLLISGCADDGRRGFGSPEDAIWSVVLAAADGDIERVKAGAPDDATGSDIYHKLAAGLPGTGTYANATKGIARIDDSRYSVLVQPDAFSSAHLEASVAKPDGMGWVVTRMEFVPVK